MKCLEHSRIKIFVAEIIINIFGVRKRLKELRNLILRIIRLWSSFCSITVYTSLQFLRILLRNYFSVFHLVLCLICVLNISVFYVSAICDSDTS